MDIQGFSIQSYRSQLERSDTTARLRTAGAENSQPKNQAPAADSVQLSQDGVLRTTALSTALSTPDVRQEKVDAIKQQIADGTYKINTQKIATKILQDENF